MAGLLRRFVELNRRVSYWERSVLAPFTTDGMRGGADFSQRVLPGLLRPGIRVLDVGGGMRPAIQSDIKRRLGLAITGLDISREQLEQSPPGAYDEWLVGDLTTMRIPGTFDLIVSRNVLEHLPDTDAAFQKMAAALTRGGLMAHLVPCRNAPYAIVNRILGNRLARPLLFALFPAQRGKGGFPAFYRDCTPSAISEKCSNFGLTVVELVPYYRSEYASFFVPLYTVELFRQFLADRLNLEGFCESFALVAKSES